MKTIKALSITALIIFSSSAIAESGNDFLKKHELDAFKNKVEHEKNVQNKINWELASVKTTSDLIAHSQLSDSPINRLSTSSKARFIDSVTFNENGVAGFYYKDLELELTKSEILQILSLMGAQNMMPLFKKARNASKADDLISASFAVEEYYNSKDFLKGYQCVARGSCEVHSRYACTSSC